MNSRFGKWNLWGMSNLDKKETLALGILEETSGSYNLCWNSISMLLLACDFIDTHALNYEFEKYIVKMAKDESMGERKID